MNSLNPVLTVEAQFRDVIEQHTGQSGSAVRKRIGDLLEMVLIDIVGLSPPAPLSTSSRINSPAGSGNGSWWPAHSLPTRRSSFDEPISMLDVSIRAEILELLDNLVRERHIAMLYITTTCSPLGCSPTRSWSSTRAGSSSPVRHWRLSGIPRTTRSCRCARCRIRLPRSRRCRTT